VNLAPNKTKPQDAFTLMEMLLALAVSAIVLAGIGSVFYSAMRLRERTTAMLDEAAPLHNALGLLKHDLLGAVPPDGVLAGDFKSGALTLGMGHVFGLQLSTTTGVIRDDAPWGDLQEVVYELREPSNRKMQGKDLVRTTIRNLISTTQVEEKEEWLMGNVESLEFLCFDGSDWRDSWDTSLTETNLPLAVRVRIQTVAAQNVDRRALQPIEMVIPLVTLARTNATASTTGGGQ
jgi:prepilin-type N-terminal cleavage/methylation domain-containing protein